MVSVITIAKPAESESWRRLMNGKKINIDIYILLVLKKKTNDKRTQWGYEEKCKKNGWKKIGFDMLKSRNLAKPITQENRSNQTRT